MIQPSLFDYGLLDDETRTFVQEKAQTIHTRLKRTAEDIIAIGQDLIEVKERLGHGRFMPWVTSEFEMSQVTAVKFMHVAGMFSKFTLNLNLPVSVLYELAAPSTPDEVVEMVETGVIPPTIPAIREAKQELQQENLTPRQFLEEVIPGYDGWHEDDLPDIDPRATWKLIDEQKRREPLTSPDDLPASFGLVNGKPFNVPLQESPFMKSSTLLALQSSESNEWFTPALYIEAAREVMEGIDLDPASCEQANEVVKATTYYDISKNGLLYPWTGHIWLNPPYGFTDGRSNQEVWTHRLIEQYKKGSTTEAVLLVNANTEARWFKPLYDVGFICFTDHRIRFYSVDGDSNSQPTQGNALVYFGKRYNRFIEKFRQFGTIVRKVG